MSIETQDGLKCDQAVIGPRVRVLLNRLLTPVVLYVWRSVDRYRTHPDEEAVGALLSIAPRTSYDNTNHMLGIPDNFLIICRMTVL